MFCIFNFKWPENLSRHPLTQNFWEADCVFECNSVVYLCAGESSTQCTFLLMPLVGSQTINTVGNWLINSIKIILKDDSKISLTACGWEKNCQHLGGGEEWVRQRDHFHWITSSVQDKCYVIIPMWKLFPVTCRVLKITLLKFTPRRFVLQLLGLGVFVCPSDNISNIEYMP